jgi:hypothetical protein
LDKAPVAARESALIEHGERRKMLAAHSIGPTMVGYLQEIGIEKLSDLRGADPHELAMRIDIALGRRHMNRQGLAALVNLIELAEKS